MISGSSLEEPEILESHGRLLSRPMIRPEPRRQWRPESYRDLRLDMRVRIVVFEREILKTERVDVPHFRVDSHGRRGRGSRVSCN